MERGRILILGNSKDTTYEIRNLLDNQRFELEIALSPEVGKQVLNSRKMNLIVIHTEMLQSQNVDFLQFLKDRINDIPMMILGEQAEQFQSTFSENPDVRCFGKPYEQRAVISFIKAL
ncbi:MAG: hypothetical protein HY717_14240 [Planctomycetes bacterium]|nr:hypothetical protein [Planctomycetota bacterium]